MLKQRLFSCLLLLLAMEFHYGFGQEATQKLKQAPNEWEGLVPLHSTRADVERLLGKPAVSHGFVYIYKTENERVDVLYSAGRCESSGVERWNVARDVAISIEITPQQTTPLEDLHLDKTKYVRFQESHPNNWVQYQNQEDGIYVHSILDGNNESLYFIEYKPSAQDKSLQCS